MSTENGEIFPVVGERLKEERKRLRFSQEALCSVLGIRDTKTVRSWESGITAPDAFALETMYRSGFDVTYLVTGQRAPMIAADAARNQYVTPAQAAAAEISGLSLTRKEADVVLMLARRLAEGE